MPKIKMEATGHSLITEGVQEHEQTLSTIKPFWVFLVANIGIGNWLMGVLIAGLGLNFTDALFTILLGSIVGSALPAATAILGPRTRLSQIEAGRFALGQTGKKIPALLNWVGATGWDVINNVLSTAALVALVGTFGIFVPFWAALAILVAIQLFISIYGHHLIQETSKYTAVLLGLFFIVIGLIALQKAGSISAVEGTASIKDILSAFVLLVAYNISWATYASDYTRYLPKNTPSKNIFFGVFLALFLSLFVVASFGYVTASVVTEQTPDGVMEALQKLTGHFAPLVLFLIAFNSIPVNAVNDNSAAYSLISVGIKISRPIAATFGALLGYIVCIWASSSFIDFFENFLFFFAHWLAPWAAILLVHWFMVGKKERKTPSGITPGCVILIVVSVLSIALFSSNTLYVGILSEWIGGADLGPFIGFGVAGLVYFLTLRSRKSIRL